jgi:3-keto-5-aminohexanoate cleavage enzyme
MPKINWDRVNEGVRRDRERIVWRPYGAPTIGDLEHTAFHDAPISEPWDLPDRLIVSVAITGAFFRAPQNPKQPLTVEAILESARSVLNAGASTVHIHVRDDRGYNVLSYDRFKAVIDPLKREYPDLVVDGCLVPVVDGEWEEMKRVLSARILDAAPINPTATYVGDSMFVKPTPILIEKTRLILESGALPEIAVYTDGDVSNADRYLIRSGLVKTPAVWLILPALPGCSPMDNPRQMVEGLMRTAGAIRDIDEKALILVCAAGRASMALATLAASIGLHIRVGMEDTYYLWPHRETKIQSNLEPFALGAKLAEVVGRPVATRAEYRQLLGLKPVDAVAGTGS